MNLPTLRDLQDYYCVNRSVPSSNGREENPYFEYPATRRYNYAPSSDKKACRVVFLKDVLKNPDNKTLCRRGRFIWCTDLRYEGRNKQGYREMSFSVDNADVLVADDADVLVAGATDVLAACRCCRHTACFCFARRRSLWQQHKLSKAAKITTSRHMGRRGQRAGNGSKSDSIA